MDRVQYNNRLTATNREMGPDISLRPSVQHDFHLVDSLRRRQLINDISIENKKFNDDTSWWQKIETVKSQNEKRTMKL